MHLTGSISSTTNHSLPFSRIIQLASTVIFVGSLAGCNVEITPQAAAADETATSADEPAESTEPGNTEQEITETSSATLYWSAPVKRVDGSALAQEDINGFLIRYYPVDDQTEVELITLEDSSARRFDIDDLEQADQYTYEIATMTTDGLTSEFVTVGN